MEPIDMHHAPDPATVTSMDELRAFLVALGDNPESVGYADDRDQRRGTDASRRLRPPRGMSVRVLMRPSCRDAGSRGLRHR